MLPILVASLDIIPFALFIRYSALLIGKNNHKGRLVAFVIYSTSKLIFMGGFALWSGQIALVMLGMVISSTLACIAAKRIIDGCWFFTMWDRYPSPLKTLIAHLWPRGETIIPSEIKTTLIFCLATGIINNGDVWALKLARMSSETIGEYGVAVNIVKPGFLFMAAITQVLAPRIALRTSLFFAWKEDLECRRIAYLSLSALLLGACSCALLAQPITLLLFGNNYSQATRFVFGLPLASIPLIAGFNLSQLLFYGSRARQAGYCLLLSSALLVVVSYIGVLTCGALGAMAGPFIAGWILLLLALRIATYP
jgi:hypothetical protein